MHAYQGRSGSRPIRQRQTVCGTVEVVQDQNGQQPPQGGGIQVSSAVVLVAVVAALAVLASR